LKAKLLIVALLLFASIQCVRSIFFVNFSYLSMAKYEQGTAPLPYQARVLMIPAMRWAHGNSTLNAISDRHNALPKIILEPLSPEKLVATATGIACMIGLGILTILEARRRQFSLWWLPWAISLEVLYTTYAARATMNVWYPYDLPQVFLFGLGTFFVLRKWYYPLLCLMPLFAANRETSIFLVLLWIVQEYDSSKLKLLVQAASLTIAWASVRIYIAHVYRNNAPTVGTHFTETGYLQHFPQILSAYGFLLPVLFVYRSRLSAEGRKLLYAMIACSAFILLFGVWTETRIFGEFTFLFSLLATEAWENHFSPVPVLGLSACSDTHFTMSAPRRSASSGNA
jgi:hypothetical protein